MRNFLNHIRKKLLLRDHVCPWWLAYTWDNRFRTLFQNPEKILGQYVHRGMTILDVGCGMGFFSISMARLVGERGRVIVAVDLQEKMIDIVRKRSEEAGISERIDARITSGDKLCIEEKIDFALTFWMVHEVPDKEKFIEEIYGTLKSPGKYLIVEPKIHTSRKQYDSILEMCNRTGFREIENPPVALSRTALFEK